MKIKDKTFLTLYEMLQEKLDAHYCVGAKIWDYETKKAKKWNLQKWNNHLIEDLGSD